MSRRALLAAFFITVGSAVTAGEYTLVFVAIGYRQQCLEEGEWTSLRYECR